jgi:predicted unusual protein kinase regulating ubiquinone biosynthesis (AarF/ABC1/UbiB family)
MDKTIDSTEAVEEVGERLREELEYDRELKHMRLFALMLADEPRVKTPEPLDDLSTKRLLTMTWLEGRGLLAWLDEPQELRNRIAELLFKAWWGPMTHYGVIHGDPHLGNKCRAPASFGLRLRPHLPAALPRRRCRPLAGPQCERHGSSRSLL